MSKYDVCCGTRLCTLALSGIHRGSCDHWREEFLLQQPVLPCQVQSHIVTEPKIKNKNRKNHNSYSHRYNDPALTAMCSVHKIFHFLPEAKWPFVDTLVNVHWSKWILQQVLYQVPATRRVPGVVFALNHCTGMHTWGGHNMVNDLQIYPLSGQLLQSGNVSFLIGEQLWVLFFIWNVMSSKSLE